MSTLLQERPVVAPVAPARPGVRVRGVALAGGLLTTVVGLAGAGRPSLWYDEAASLSAAERPLRSLPALLSDVDLVHGLYYVLLHLWIEVFGTSALAVRSLSALGLGAACAGCIVLADRLGGRTVAVVAGLAFPLLPGLAWSATEAREWSLVTAVVVWATVALLGARWKTHGVLLAVAIGVSVLSVLVVLPHLWLARRQGRLRAVGLACAGAVLVTLPLLVAASTQRQQVAWIALTPRDVAARALLDQLFTADQNRPGRPVAGLVLAGVFVVLATAALARGRLVARFGAVWFLGPTALLAAPVLVGVQLYQERYLTFAAPGAVLLAAEGAVVLARSARALAVVVVLAGVVAGGSSLVAQRDPLAKSEDDYRGLAAAARGADQVLYERGDARGVRIAYPADFAGVADVRLVLGPTDSGTLWGVEGDAPPHGRVVAYEFRYLPPDGTVWLADFLRDSGCRREAEVARSRWVAVSYACP